MPAIHTYEVLRTQKVTVRATDTNKATQVANAYLDGSTIGTEIGTVLRSEETVDMHIKQIS